MWLLANGPVSFSEGVCAFLGNGPSLVWLGKSKPFVSSSFFPQFLCELPTQAPDHNIKGLLFPNQKRLGSLPKKAHTPSENDTSPSASSHMDTSHSSRELNMPDSELTRLGCALPSRVFLSYENCPSILGHWTDKHHEPHM